MTREEVFDLIRKADQAGDTESVGRLITHLDSMGPTQKKREARGFLQSVDDFVRGAADAATFGFSDEIAAAAGAGPALFTDDDYGERYEANLAKERAQDAAANPWVRGAGQLAGGVASGVAAAPATLAALPARMPLLAKGITQGTAQGAAYGFGSGEGGIENRAIEAGKGAAIGGATGAALPLVVGAGKSVARSLSPKGAQTRSADRLAAQLRRDKITQRQMVKELADLGPEAIPADIERAVNVRGLTRAVANVPGQGRTLAENVLQGRQLGSRARTSSAVEKAFGSSGDDFYSTLDRVRQSRKAAAKPLYEKAYARPIQFSGPMEQFLETGIAKRAFSKAQKIWQAERAASRLAGEAPDEPQWFIRLMDDGNVQDVRSVPNTRVWDYMVRGVDDMLEKYRDKTTGKLVLDTQGRALQQVRSALDRALKEANPDYAAAKNAWAGGSRAMGAMERGRSFIRRDAEVSQKEFQLLSDSEREMFGMGVARGIMDIVNSAPDGANVVRRLVNTPKVRDKIAVVMRDPTTKSAFDAALKRETIFNQTRNAALSGSRTTPLAKEIEDAGLTGVGGLMTDAAGAARGSASGLLGLASRGAQAAASRYKAGINESTRNELANLLFPQTTAQQRQIVQRLQQQKAVQDTLDRALSGSIYGATVGGAGTRGQNQ